ncbi:MAG TPA: hypothetical protein VFS43_29945 [Polyangiaceae bacterium]|nr:hypothetical protein [Polyangiaceae bacterium]
MGVEVAAALGLFFGEVKRLGRVAALGREKERERARVREAAAALDLGEGLVGPGPVAGALARLAEQPGGLDEGALLVGLGEELGRPAGVAAGERDAALADEGGRVVVEVRERAVEAGLGPLDVALVPEEQGGLHQHPGPGLGVARVEARVDGLPGDRLRPGDVAAQPAQVRGARERGQVRLEVDHALGGLDREAVAPELEGRVAEHAEGDEVVGALREDLLGEAAGLVELVLVQPHLRPQPEAEAALGLDAEHALGAGVGVGVVARVARLAGLAHPGAPEQHPALDPLGLHREALLVLLDEGVDGGLAAGRRQGERVARGGAARLRRRGRAGLGRRRGGGAVLAAGRQRDGGGERRRHREAAPPGGTPPAPGGAFGVRRESGALGHGSKYGRGGGGGSGRGAGSGRD